MIAKRTIIQEGDVWWGLLRDDSARDVVDMAVALQWHVSFNGDEPVALATPRSAEAGINGKDVLLVVCDCKQGRKHDTRVASALARHIFDTYNAREARSSANGAEGAPPFTERFDVARWLADAITGGLKHVCQSQPILAGYQSPPPSAGTSTGLTDPIISVVAAVIHRDKLLVARYGAGRVYLLRNGALQNLTDESFTDATHAEQLEPDLGQLELVGEDRVLLCTEPFHHRLQDAQIRSVLRSTPSSRRAAQTLLEAATKAPTDENIALAVADYVTGRTGTYAIVPVTRATTQPVTGPRRGTFRSLLALGALLVLIAVLGTAIVAFSGGIRNMIGMGGFGAQNNTTPATPAAPLSANALISATVTRQTEIIETAVAATVTAAATDTPAPVAADTTTNTVEAPATFTPEVSLTLESQPPTEAVEVATAIAVEAAATPTDGLITYTVKAGDTPLDIARANNVSLDELQRNNPDMNPTSLQVGQVLIIRLGAAASALATPVPSITPTSVIVEQPTPTQRPTRRPRPRPTATPVPPTATPVPPAPTETPKPWSQPPGDPQPQPTAPPPPPCPPGATCP